MTLVSPLLRVLLCVILIANSIGFAHASTRMQLAHAAHPVSQTIVEAPALAAGSDCHEVAQAAMDSVVMSHAAMGHGSDDGPDSASGIDDMDCCDGAACQCACAQHASAAFVSTISTAPMPVHAAVRLGGHSQHAQPRLPHLIRPPID